MATPPFPFTISVRSASSCSTYLAVLALALLALAPLAHAQTTPAVVVDKTKFDALHKATTRLWAAQTARTGRDRLMELAGDVQVEVVLLLDKSNKKFTYAEKVLLGCVGEGLGILRLLDREGLADALIGTPIPWFDMARKLYLRAEMPQPQQVSGALARVEKMIAGTDGR